MFYGRYLCILTLISHEYHLQHEGHKGHEEKILINYPPYPPYVERFFSLNTEEPTFLFESYLTQEPA